MKDVRQDLLKLAEAASVWESDQERNDALVAAQRFYEDSYGEIAHSSIYLALAEYRERGLKSGGNYTANDDTWPSEINFQNGRKVGIAFDGDKPYLTIGYGYNESRCHDCGTVKVLIRGQFPNQDNRDVCPQCVQERLDSLTTTSGQAKASGE